MTQLTADQRIRLSIGDLIVQVEIFKDQMAALSAELESEKAKVADLEAAAKAAKSSSKS